MHENSPRVVVIGAGFGGLEAARNLAKLPVRITLIDRTNHHTFQPLLYQVATAGISPGEIAAPIRWILRSRKNVEVMMDEVVGLRFDSENCASCPIWKFHSIIWLSLPAPSILISVMTNGSRLRPD